MSRILIFHLRNFFLKKSTYVIIIISILILSFTSYINNSITPRTYGFLFLANGIWYTVMFFSSIIFVIIQIISIFKKSEDDGTSLFLLSKPISRFKQVISQLIILWISIIYFSLSIFVIGIIVGLLDTTTHKIEMVKFASSVLVADIIIMAIFGSLILLTSLWMSSKGIIVIWSIIIFFLPTFSLMLVSFTTSPFSQGNNYSFMPVTTDVEKTRTDMKPEFVKNNEMRFDYTKTKQSSAQKDAWKDYKNASENWTKWVDPYGQLKDLYYSFSNTANNSSGGKWIQETAIAKKSPNDWILKNNSDEYLLLWKSTNDEVAGRGDPSKYINKKFNNVINNKVLDTGINNIKTEIDKYGFGQQVLFAQTILISETADVKDTIDKAVFVANFATPDSYFQSATWYSLALLYYWNTQKIITLNFNINFDINKFVYNQNELILGGVNQQLMFLKVGQTYNKFIEKDLVPKIALISIWLSIFVATTITTSYHYIKKKH